MTLDMLADKMRIAANESVREIAPLQCTLVPWAKCEELTRTYWRAAAESALVALAENMERSDTLLSV